MWAHSHKIAYTMGQHSQSLCWKYAQIHLSQGARTAITARQREAAHHYNKDINATWAQIDDVTQNIVTVHNKSVSCVQSQLHMGCVFSHGKHKKNSPWNMFMWKK